MRFLRLLQSFEDKMNPEELRQALSVSPEEFEAEKAAMLAAAARFEVENG